MPVDDEGMCPSGTDNTVLQEALRYEGRGYSVVFGAEGTKYPRGRWGRAQTQRATASELRKSFRAGDVVCIVTGQVSGLAVLDCDSPESVESWRRQLGTVLDETASVNTSRGRHFYFRLHEPLRSAAGNGWDLRADGGLVVAPLSIHPSGHRYQWTKDLDRMRSLPPELRIEGSGQMLLTMRRS
jgi:hypothetical protein